MSAVSETAPVSIAKLLAGLFGAILALSTIFMSQAAALSYEALFTDIVLPLFVFTTLLIGISLTTAINWFRFIIVACWLFAAIGTSELAYRVYGT